MGLGGDINAGVRRACEDAAKTIADDAIATWHTNLEGSLKTQTPYYATQLTRVKRGAAEVVTDRGVVYGPWLEGVGTRNYPKTRFRGYWSMRRAVEELNQLVPDMVGRALEKVFRG